MPATIATEPPPADSPPPIAVRIPLGAFRVISRLDDTEILIVHGEEHRLGAGERLVLVSWHPSIAAAESLSWRCSQLLEDAGVKPDAEGWHRFAVAHLKTLLREATRSLDLPQLDEPHVGRRQAWTQERVARLGFLAGQGYTAKRIAADPLIRSTENNVWRQAHRFGIALSEVTQGRTALRLPLDTLGAYDRAARDQGITTASFIRRFLIGAAARSGTLEAIG